MKNILTRNFVLHKVRNIRTMVLILTRNVCHFLSNISITPKLNDIELKQRVPAVCIILVSLKVNNSHVDQSNSTARGIELRVYEGRAAKRSIRTLNPKSNGFSSLQLDRVPRGMSTVKNRPQADLGANCEQRLAATIHDHAEEYSAYCEPPRADEPSVRFSPGVNEKRAIRHSSYCSF